MISQSKSPFFTPNRIGFSLSLIAHLAFALMFYDYFHNIDVQQNGDEITSIALATFQTPSNEPVVEPPKPQPIVKPKKKHHRKEIVKEHGKLAKKEEEVVPPTPTPQAKPDEKVEEGEMIQTLSYRNGEEDEVFAKIKRAIERRNKYPNMAKKRGLEGEVIVEFIIYKDGKVSNIRIVKPCPHESFNTAAINAVRKAQGDFPSLDVTTKIELPIVYELKMSKL
ncbi:energy transducer TonB [Helicobacter jaachi]|uniref:Energy transducer TonB n=2 Tax=Helicobacter jaachi TaxID=1677920 RepID=A0A4U8TDE3_9HELI|nr:energy transducer TonB [Helicobacter jaachi]